jgi:hypothetical protein
MKKVGRINSYNLAKAIGKHGGLIIQIIIRDGSGAKLDFFTFNLSDKKRQKSIEQVLRDKYDIQLGTEDKDMFDF